jgi:internalin A
MATVPGGPVSRPWRRSLRFSVRGLIVIVLVIGAGLGWLVRSARIQREAVATIERAGGRVRYDSEWSKGKSIPAGKPWAPRWLTDFIGVDYFGRVTTVRLFSSSRASDATLAHVGRLTRLQRLNLDQSAVSDSGLAHLKGLTNLTFLALGGTQVTDAGLAHLKGLTNLSVLDLGDTQVTDAGLAHLKGLTNFSSLNLNGTHVSDAGAKELQRALPSLRIVR